MPIVANEQGNPVATRVSLFTPAGKEHGVAYSAS
jgi:hypothetical protein